MIAEKVKNDLVKGIGNWAKRNGACPCKTQIRVSLALDKRPEGTFAVPKYHMLKEYKVMEEVTVNEVRGVKMDLVGMGSMVSNFITNKLVGMADEMGVGYTDISAMILNVKDEEVDEENEYTGIKLWIYNGRQPVKELTVEELLAG